MDTLNCLEIIGSKLCEEFLFNSFSLYKRSIEPWVICCNEGGVVQNFGKEVDKLIDQALVIYENDGCLFRFTKIFGQKKEMLKESILFDLQRVFEKQVLRTKEMSLQSFKESLAPIQITNQVEQDIQIIIKTVDYYFREIIKTLISRYSIGLWFYEKEHRELMQDMREISIERLQMAKLQGIYLQKNKNPISLSFHFLHPHPFGKDLRFDYMNVNDSFNFNSNFTQKAGVMRESVSSRGKVVKIISSDEPSLFSDNDLIYKDNPLNAFQNNNH